MQPETIELAGSHVRLETLAHRHAEGLARAAATAPRLYRWSPVPQGVDGFHAYVETALGWRTAGTAVPFAIVRLSDQTVVGSTRIWNIERWAWPRDHPLAGRSDPDACEIGYTWLTASAIRTAVNTETKLLLLTLVFEQWQTQRVCFHADARNERSRAALERLGARFEGLLRAHRLAVDATPRTSVRFSILASEWPMVKERLHQRLPAAATCNSQSQARVSRRQSPGGAGRTNRSVVQIGALAPLTRPGWVEAGHHLLAGLELAVRDVNDSGGIAGRPLELEVRDTAADPRRAATAVDELARHGVAALVGEYHSVVARAAAARADALGVPFLCSSAVLDALTEKRTDWVARLSPPQSQGWQIYADFLLRGGHSRIAVAAESSVYWASGIRVLRDYLGPRGGTIIEFDMSALAASAVCDELVDTRATALLLLVGHPEPAVSIVKSVRHDQRLTEITIGAPAGQPEFAEWSNLLGADGAAIPFLRYLPERLTSVGVRVERALRQRFAEPPSFVAFEGYDSVAALADLLRRQGVNRARIAESWRRVAVEGTRGQISFVRKPGISVWQCASSPIQVVDRDPAGPDRFRVLHAN